MDAELKDELDRFVLVVLGEYAKLFLESGTDVSRDRGHETVSSI